MWNSRISPGRPLLLLLLLLLHVSATTTAASLDSAAARKERLEAKRAFDRVKQHPLVNEEEEGPTVEYKAADGSIKSMTQAELQKRLQQQEAVLPHLDQDGSALSKSEEGKATIEELKTKDPYLSRMIQASEFALHRLQEAGEVGDNARLKGFHSVDDDNEKDTTVVGADLIRLHLHLHVANDDTEDERKFEVLLEGREGFGAITKAWRVVGTQKEAIDLPAPSPFRVSSPSSVWNWLSMVLGVVGGAQTGGEDAEWLKGVLLMVGGGLLCLGMGLVLMTTAAAGDLGGRKGD
ncbi:Hypothetical protein NocV09_00501200 [Nannochloropsis oceanica]